MKKLLFLRLTLLLFALVPSISFSQDTSSVSKIKIRKNSEESCAPYIDRHSGIINDSAHLYEVKRNSYINKSKLSSLEKVLLPAGCTDSIFSMEVRIFEGKHPMKVFHTEGPEFTPQIRNYIQGLNTKKLGCSVFVLVRVADPNGNGFYRPYSFHFLLTNK